MNECYRGRLKSLLNAAGIPLTSIRSWPRVSGCESLKADAEIPELGVEVEPPERSDRAADYPPTSISKRYHSAGAVGLRVDQEIRSGFARGRACLRERFTSPTSKPRSCPPTFPFERIPRLSGRTTPLCTRRYSPGVLGDIRAALAHDAPPGPESPGIRGLCKTHSIPAVVVTAITSRTEKREFRRKHRPMRTLDTD